MGPVGLALAPILAVLMILFWRQQKEIERRVASQRSVPREQLIPRHYKSFTEVETKLWHAVQGKHSIAWEDVRFKPGEPAFQIIRDYVQGLDEDFQTAHRIFGHIIIRSPEIGLLAQFERERVKIEFAYYRCCVLLRLRLRTAGVSIAELRRLTDIVSTFAYRVRALLNAFEDSGNTEFVEFILRRS